MFALLQLLPLSGLPMSGRKKSKKGESGTQSPGALTRPLVCDATPATLRSPTGEYTDGEPFLDPIRDTPPFHTTGWMNFCHDFCAALCHGCVGIPCAQPHSCLATKLPKICLKAETRKVRLLKCPQGTHVWVVYIGLCLLMQPSMPPLDALRSRGRNDLSMTGPKPSRS